MYKYIDESWIKLEKQVDWNYKTFAKIFWKTELSKDLVKRLFLENFMLYPCALRLYHHNQ